MCWATNLTNLFSVFHYLEKNGSVLCFYLHVYYPLFHPLPTITCFTLYLQSPVSPCFTLYLQSPVSPFTYNYLFHPLPTIICSTLYLLTDWEVRVSVEGRPLYYDHINQRVSLDRPESSADGRDATSPTDNAPLGSLQNFLARCVSMAFLGGCGFVFY